MRRYKFPKVWGRYGYNDDNEAGLHATFEVDVTFKVTIVFFLFFSFIDSYIALREVHSGLFQVVLKAGIPRPGPFGLQPKFTVWGARAFARPAESEFGL